MTIQYDKLILTTILAAKRAGEAILDVYDSDFAVEQKDDKSPLTLADKRSNEIIENVLEQTVTVNNSTVPILSEEGKEISYEEERNGNISGSLTLLTEQRSLLREMESSP